MRAFHSNDLNLGLLNQLKPAEILMVFPLVCQESLDSHP